MATYKVPQDVEAEDKLVGFLSLKQFIFVLVMVASLWICWILLQVNIVLVLIPLPITIVSGVLGLYQRKDQPVEVFLASWLRYKLKPRVRKWDQEGLEERVIITVPKFVQKVYTKGLTQQQVDSRLGQLSSMLDSRGWASKYATQVQTGQRLFNAEELSRYTQPVTPIEAERDSMRDQYDHQDPRNRTAQEVTRDFNQAEKAYRKNVLSVVQQARSEASSEQLSPEPLLSIPTPIPTPPEEPDVSTVQQAKPTPTQNQPTLTKPKPEPEEATSDDGEVVINLHHKK